jgi:hypothetical protein
MKTVAAVVADSSIQPDEFDMHMEMEREIRDIKMQIRYPLKVIAAADFLRRGGHIELAQCLQIVREMRRR